MNIEIESKGRQTKEGINDYKNIKKIEIKKKKSTNNRRCHNIWSGFHFSR